MVHGPTIRTLAVAEDGPLRTATEELIAHPPHALVANTGLGIRSWLVAAESWGLDTDLVQVLRSARIYARGPKASGALRQAGLEVAGKAPTERLAEAVDLALDQCAPGDRVALQVDGSGDSPEIARLRAGGLDVVVVPVYAWKLPVDRQPAIRLAEGVIAGRVHAVTFTAGPAVRNWFAMAAEEGIDSELRAALTDGRAVVGCVGPVCRESLTIEGLESPELVQPHVARIGPLVRSVAERLTARSQ